MTGFMNIMRAARFHRSFTTIASMLFAAAFAGRVTWPLVLLIGAAFILYGFLAIHNAKVDGDYELPSYYPAVMAAMLIVVLALAISDRIVGLTVAAWVVLGIAYNTIARRIFLGDVTLLAVTHHALPAFSAGMLAGLPPGRALGIAAFLYVTCWFFIHVKNLKDIEKDAENGYDTIVTRDAEWGITLTIASFLISLGVMSGAYIIFPLGQVFIPIFTMTALLAMVSLLRIHLKRYKEALDLARLIFVGFIFAVSVSVTTAPMVIVPLASLALLYSSSVLTSVDIEGAAFYGGKALPV